MNTKRHILVNSDSPTRTRAGVGLLVGGALWYLTPLLVLNAISDRDFTTATLATVALLIGWSAGWAYAESWVVKDRTNRQAKRLPVLGLVTLSSIAALQLIAIKNQLTHPVLDFYRHDVYENTTFLFGSTVLYTLYNSFLLPGTMILIPMSLSIRNNKWLRALGIAGLGILLVDAAIKLGRFPIAFALFYIIYLKSELRVSIPKLVGALVPSILGMQWLVYVREYSVRTSFFEMISSWEINIKTLFAYNTIGFEVFNDIASHPPVDISPLNGSLIAPYLYYSEVILGRLGIYFWYPWKTVNIELVKERYFAEFDIWINAFGTNMLPAYLDIGIVGPSILGLMLGFLAAVRTEGSTSFAVRCTAFFIWIFGIYQSQIAFPIAVFLTIPFAIGAITLQRKVNF